MSHYVQIILNKASLNIIWNLVEIKTKPIIKVDNLETRNKFLSISNGKSLESYGT